MKKTSTKRKAITAKAIEKAQSELFPHLGWMKQLRSLIILLRKPYEYDDFIAAFFNWFKEGPSPDSLERLWITSECLGASQIMTCPSVKSLFVPTHQEWWHHTRSLRTLPAELGHQNYRHIEHLSYVDFENTLNCLSNLKYIRGDCKDKV